MVMSWWSVGILLAAAAIPLGLRVPLRLSLVASFTIGFLAVVAMFQYQDDEPNPWYVGFSFSVLLAVVLTVVVLLIAAARRATVAR